MTKAAQMLPVDEAKILANENAVIAFTGEKIIGYIAQTALFENGMAEIGSLIVDPAYRGEGIATNLVWLETGKVLKSGIKTVTAFCNPISAKVFEKAHFELMPVCKIPVSALELCAGCPKKPVEGGCCDRAYVYKAPQ